VRGESPGGGTRKASLPFLFYVVKFN